MIHFTSDLHMWHTNVIRYCGRPYVHSMHPYEPDTEAMNEDMVAKWNAVVKPEDTIYVLGDFSLAFRPVEIYSFRLNGTRYLVPGNHDLCHSYHKRSRSLEKREKWIQKYKDYGWIILPEQTALDLPGLGVVNLCHHPYSTEYELKNGDKYAKWRLPDDGKILLCGHVHEKWAVNRSPKNTLMINVGVDVRAFAPISLDEIISIVKE